ncbi:hypothetical protein Vc3S01_3188 [Vibrio campbellii]|nr:hypothetical protein Vc3S01_3188 [Vibrio campbellii]
MAQTHIILLAASVPFALSLAVGSNNLKIAMIQIAMEQTAEFIITKEALKMSNK